MGPSWSSGLIFCMGLLLWTSQQSPVKTEYTLGFWPLQLSRTEGENATFICNVSSKLKAPILNWYREKNGSQPEKLAAYPKDTPSSHLQDRYHIAMKGHKRFYEMTILGLRLNDSGRYFCGIINIETPTVEESGRSELNVTERIMVPTTAPPVTTQAQSEKFPWLIVIPVVVGAVLLLLLLCWILVVVEFPGRGGAENSGSNKDAMSPKKAEPCVASVSTVVYGQLDFQRAEALKQGGASSDEQTEYATIIFPEEKSAFPGSSPHRK
ncbi:programmed cell death protein 1 [Sarcophilus harrisii]|uniref:Programmed cell death 1 n=1 Tax=Sarcophilus harrisii TaxID=9305 RepID=A0A7N4PZ64_SARHA|nr:programmed cell death protein 1 [Sarcophilus harrisii]